jgi:hypothetical protein
VQEPEELVAGEDGPGAAMRERDHRIVPSRRRSSVRVAVRSGALIAHAVDLRAAVDQRAERDFGVGAREHDGPVADVVDEDVLEPAVRVSQRRDGAQPGASDELAGQVR